MMDYKKWNTAHIIYYTFLLFFAFNFLLIVLTPVLASSDNPILVLISDIIYRIYSTACHQWDDRSFHILGHKLAVCARCTFIYFGNMITLLTLYSRRMQRMDKPLISLKIYFLLALPLLIDGFTQFFGLRASTNPMRAVTGFLFGISSAYFFYTLLLKFFLWIEDKITT